MATKKPTKKMPGKSMMPMPQSTDARMAEQNAMGMYTVTRAKKPRSSKKAK